MDTDQKDEQGAELVSRKRTKQKQYPEANLNLAAEAVKCKAMTLGNAAKVYGVPKATIHFRLSPKWSGKLPRGPNPVLTTDEENKLATWIKEMERRGFPCTKAALFSKVKTFLDCAERITIFKQNTPGYKWLELFMKRRGMNDALAIRKPESISRAAATVSELDIRKWFQHIGKYLTDNNLSDILKDPRRVLNGDETSFLFDPVTKSVIASKGNQNVYLVQQAEAKKNVTVLFTFDADGYMFPPDTILPYKRLPTPVVRSFPASWGIGKSERGWMDKENFLAYIQEVLYPSLVERDVPFPVIYFVDGHSSHTGIEAAELCESLGIILVALFPNATHIMQPCDVAIFKPLKNQWTKEMDRWKMENEGLMFTIDHFAAALESAINAGIKTSTVRAGFRKCGLFPFDENSIDYSRCLQRVSENQTKLIDSSLSPVPDISTAGSSRGLDVGSPIASGTSLYLHSSSFDRQSVQTTTCVSQSQDPDITLAEHASVEQQLPGPDSCLMNIITDRTRSPNPEPTLHEQTANSTPLPHSFVGTDPSNSLQNADRRASISNFLQLPPTPKRKQVKRNYKQKRHFILTAADHIKELERKEEEKENAAIRRQEAIDLRAAKKRT